MINISASQIVFSSTGRIGDHTTRADSPMTRRNVTELITAAIWYGVRSEKSERTFAATTTTSRSNVETLTSCMSRGSDEQRQRHHSSVM